MQALSALALIAALLVLPVTYAVDRNNFKKCDDSSFCRRNRALTPGESPFEADVTSLQQQEGSFRMEVTNTQTQASFVMDVFMYDDATARVKLNERDPLYSRYEVLDVVQPLKAAANAQVSVQGNGVVATYGQGCKVLVNAKPLQVEFYRDDKVVVLLNRRGLLNFEHYRHKPEGDGDSDGQWDETFKSHKDHKPRGPASVGLDISFPGIEHVYGIPEHAHHFDLPSTRGSQETEPFRLYNLDVFEYELEETMALYGSIPYMLGHSAQQTAGVFFLNAAEMWIDISSSRSQHGSIIKAFQSLFGDNQEVPQTDTHWFAESGIIDLFVFLGPRPSDVARQYATVTGTPSLPPQFSIAFHQCRWNYNDEEDVAFVDSQFDEHDMPVDVIWLDIEHTDGKRYMTWDSQKFPTPEEMQNKVASKGRKMVTIVDPHIKRASGYHVHEAAEEKGLYVKDHNGNNYDGWCWPGSSSWLDFMNPEIREWWATMLDPQHYKGSTQHLYVWNDMNEPSVFNGPEVTMHKDAKHFGDNEHRDVHNIYGMWQQAATADGIVRRSGGRERPFVLSRAFYAGSQRYGAIWTGDNTAAWDHLQYSVPMLLSISVAGLPFAGADIGGFFGNPDEDLQVRWFQAGAYQPFMRAHAHLDAKRREPYLLSEENRRIVRKAIRARYELLPFWYAQYFMASQSGQPVMRPLWWEYPEDAETFSIEESYLIGSDLLVAPVLRKGSTSVSAYLPGTEPWYDTRTMTAQSRRGRVSVQAPITDIPVFQRGGSIVPKKLRVRRASSLMRKDPFTLVAALDSQGSASGKLFVDDYHTFDYQQGRYLLRQFTIETTSNQLLVQSSNAREGSQPSGFETSEWIERITVAGVTSQPKSVSIQTGSGEPTLADSRNLDFYYNANTKVLEIKKPSVGVDKDFRVVVTL